MIAEEVYAHYSIPPILQKHMYTAAALGDLIASYWTSDNEHIDRDLIVKTLLIHDMGNLVKFSLGSDNAFLPADELPFWRNLQTTFIKKYGSNDHVATVQIAEELGISENIVGYLKETNQIETEADLLKQDWNFAIYFYCDFRLAPQGVVTLDQRIDDLLERYKEKPSTLWSKKEKAEQWRDITKSLEKRLQERVTLDLEAITDRDLVNLSSLSSYQVSPDGVSLPPRIQPQTQ